ncbi:MAG TPA: sigma-E processing peptidase SpoIIGA [Firmicutes bacterium]|nr:sigma-E processing peptidase SpoIIGA [Candidatus Fermentithermobacillaceae bacterium]
MVRLIYVDVLFAVNMAVNYIILLATGKLAGRAVKPLRLCLSSASGALYAGLALVFPSSLAFSLPARIAFGIFMVALAFPGLRGVGLFTVVASFFLCSALTAGTAYALLQSGANRALRASLLGGTDPSVHWWMVAFSLAALSAFPVLAKAGGYHPGRPLPLMNMELVIGGQTLGLTALVDTGNNLRDPVSGLPVVVVDWESLRKVMPDEVYTFFQSTWDRIPSCLADSPIGRRLRLIPYESLSGKKGVLPGFRPDRLILTEKGRRKVLKNAIVGVSGERLSPNGLYQALLHPDLTGP